MTRSGTQIRTLHVDDLSVDDVVALAGSGAAERASLYVPTHPSDRLGAQSAVRLRDLITSAEKEVGDRSLLAPARALVDDRTFWAHPSEGLALLAEPGTISVIWMSEPVVACEVVSDRFHVKPLLHALAHVQRFEVLALSRHAVRLIRVIGQRVGEEAVTGLPAGMPEALRWDDRERQLQSHAGGRVGAGRVTAAFHGQDGGAAVRDADVARYLRLVDDAVAHHRGQTSLPLVLAGVDELVAAYRHLTRCPPVVTDHVPGNPDQERAAALAERARDLVEPATLERERRARDAFLAGAASTVDTVEQAVIAAAAGQVASIFVPADRNLWGRYRPGHALLVEHEERQAGDHDLADVAATETLRHGGEAHIVPADEIPGGGSAAATLRY